MESFIKDPNLPNSKVSLGLIDGRVRKSIVYALEKMGIKVITTGRCEALYDSVSYHPDMFIHHIGEDIIVSAPNAPPDTIEILHEYGFQIIMGDKNILRKYPENVAYNVARIGNYAICNLKHTDRTLLNLLSDAGAILVDTKQGYAKCSICITGKNSLITSDDGVYSTLIDLGFDVLQISPGNIELRGLNYGFIGGSSGFIDSKVLAFTGNIKRHPDFKKITEFLDKQFIEIKILDKNQLTDVGTFIPLKEYIV